MTRHVNYTHVPRLIAVAMRSETKVAEQVKLLYPYSHITICQLYLDRRLTRPGEAQDITSWNR